jgi:uncharacterized protein HemX
MIGRALLVAAVIGGVTFLIVQVQRKADQERTRRKTSEKEAKSRWENEGGAPAPSVS